MGLDLDPERLERYSRHLIMDGVGPPGQKALFDADVLVIGAGGLGTPVIQYLAAAGIGHLGIADNDVVERSNLQRQVIHGTADIGRPKVESATEAVADLNNDVDVDPHPIRVTADNVENLIVDYDFVVDATDNFETRYLINDACILANKPYSHGAVYRFEGQVTTFTAGDDSPCYRCIFPEAPPPGTVPDCAEAGVLGILPGTIGAIQATETIKHLIQAGTTLDGRIIYYDARRLWFDEVSIRKRADCPLCGDEPRLESVHDIDYRNGCAIPAE